MNALSVGFMVRLFAERLTVGSRSDEEKTRKQNRKEIKLQKVLIADVLQST